MFISGRKIVGVGIENDAAGGAYSGLTLSNGNFNFPVIPDSITCSPEFAMAQTMYATGNFDEYQEIIGKQTGKIGFDCWFQPSTNAASGVSLATPAAWMRNLRCAGFSATATASGYVLDFMPHNNTAVTATVMCCEVEEGPTSSAVQLAYKLTGAMTTLKIAMDSIGERVKFSFEYEGSMTIADLAAANSYLPALADTSIANGVLASTLTAYGAATDPDKISIDLGIKLGRIVSPAKATGIKGVNITGLENPNMTIDPYLKAIGTDAFYTKWLASTTGAYSMTVGNNMAISAPAIQIKDGYKGGDRDGNTINPIVLGLKHSAGSAILRVLQGTA